MQNEEEQNILHNCTSFNVTAPPCLRGLLKIIDVSGKKIVEWVKERKHEYILECEENRCNLLQFIIAMETISVPNREKKNGPKTTPFIDG